MRRPVSLLVAIASMVGLVGSPQWVHADSVAQAEARLRAVQEELDNLANQMGQLDEDYGAALDRKDQLDFEGTIADDTFSLRRRNRDVSGSTMGNTVFTGSWRADTTRI